MPLPVDTLVCDTARIAAWQQDSAFDYNRELIEEQQSVWEWLFNVIVGFLQEMLKTAMQHDLSWWLVVVGAFLLLGLAGWLIYKFRPGLFGRGKKEQMDYDLEEDTIYGIDFDIAIQKALDRQDYREAVRLKYLQTLKLLTERERIDWQLHKTPTQYTYECKDEPFLRMTQHFLRVRYGNFEATKELYEEVATENSSLVTLYSSLQKGGEA